ncbi:MAG: sensor histidine kinase [Chloroflexota bacterium]
MKNLGLDFAYVSIRAGEETREVCWTAEGPMEPAEARETGKSLEGIDAGGRGEGAGGPGLAYSTIGARASRGYAVVSSKRGDFPTDDERLLLGAATNQAAAAILEAPPPRGPAAGGPGTIEESRQANTALLLAALDADQNSEESERLRSQLHLLLEGLAEGVTIVDADGGIRFMNSAARTITGMTGDRFDASAERQHRRLDRLDGSPLAAADWPISRAMRGEQFVDEELSILKDDRLNYVTFSGNCVRGPGGDFRVAIVTCRDVTEFRRLERMRQEDTALISHDLRNPLSIIIAAAHRLRREAAGGGGEDDVDELRELIAANARRITEMIEELVEAAYLESSRAELQREPVSMIPLVKGVVARLGERERVHVATAGEGASIEGDRTRIERLVANLVDNAVKYSAPGSVIEVTVDSGPDEVVVSVRDKGRGIPPGELPFLFDRFYRVERASATRGSGLGLYIASLVAQAHGGWIGAVSEEGIGSTFTFGLPTAGATLSEE